MTPDEQSGAHLRRWLSTWVGLGLIVVAVTAVYLLLISNSLVKINDNLAAADRSVTDVAGNTRTLPDQIARVNESLAGIDSALTDLPGLSEEVSANLSDIIGSLRVIDTDLLDSAPRLDTTADNLVGTSGLVVGINTRLHDTSALLASVLGATGAVDDSLGALLGKDDQGLAGIGLHVTDINSHLRSVSGDLGNILAVLTDVNGHLDSVCHSTAVNLLHGEQAC